jgi:hypothetical protein
VISVLAILRVALRKLLWFSAIFWLTLEAWLTLDASFDLPFSVTAFVRWSHWSPPLITLILWFKQNAWPSVTVGVVMVIRQEAHRWFNTRRGRRSADQLMMAWFVFAGTLVVVDYLAPEITVHWPVSAIETTVWLVMMLVISLISRLLHPASRRAFRRWLKRWPFVHWLEVILGSLSTLRNVKGVGRHVRLPQVSNKRRAR